MPPRIDFKSQRLYVDHDLSAGFRAPLSDDHAHYLLTVLRMESGGKLLVFNGKDGEWRAEVERASKRAGTLTVLEQTRPQTPLNDLTLWFAPIKKERMDWLVQKAVEMGVGAIAPVITDHTQTTKLRDDKLRANIIEAAEQCGVLAIPDLEPAATLVAKLRECDANRALIWCDEHKNVGETATRVAALRGERLTVLIGPEGGFSDDERAQLIASPFTHPISLGPRILRADTAVVASLTAVQLLVGDWVG